MQLSIILMVCSMVGTLLLLIIVRALWICDWGVIPRYYNLGLARQSTHKQINIQVQGLFSV